tara:strand:- start:579 stop:1205 length:627 start_codon:yes stop_codon:yes gene_type:complete
MAITSLSKITVPLASDQSATAQGLLMPKLQYRFRVLLQGFGISTPSTELTKQVVDVTRPNVSFEPITLDVYNSRAYLAGKHTWEPISLTLREDVNNEVQKRVGEQLQKQFDFLEQASAAAGGDYKFVTKIEILDGGNGDGDTAANVLDTFELYGCFVESANYNTLAYATNDPVTVSLSIRYDNAIQTDDAGGIGNAVGRAFGSVLATD